MAIEWLRDEDKHGCVWLISRDGPMWIDIKLQDRTAYVWYGVKVGMEDLRVGEMSYSSVQANVKDTYFEEWVKSQAGCLAIAWAQNIVDSLSGD